MFGRAGFEDAQRSTDLRSDFSTYSTARRSSASVERGVCHIGALPLQGRGHGAGVVDAADARESCRP